MPFDPQIPIITFVIVLVINTFKILTETPSTSQSQENQFILQNDPLCGLPAGGGGCELDCDLHPSLRLFSDPTCLSDCGQYPECFQELYKDFEIAGRVGIIKQSIESWFLGTKSNKINNKILLLLSANTDIRGSLCWEHWRRNVRLESFTNEL